MQGVLMADVRPNGVSISLHWLTVLMFVVVYSTIELRELFPKGSDLREAVEW
jgi:superoxide oxidase